MLKKISVLLFCLSCLLVNNVFSWDLVYENDGNGKKVSGSFEQLLEALRNGKSIRVYWDNGNSESLVNASCVYYNNGVIVARAEYSDAEFNRVIFAVLKTDGQLIAAQRRIDSQKFMDTQKQRFPMKWFVDY